MNFPRLLLFFLLLACGATSFSANGAGTLGTWHRDYASAMNEARTENKKLLIVFTGTDWIEICDKFYNEILGDPLFIETVAEEFALLKLEYPKDNVLPREEAAQKAVLRDAYRVRGFPTVVLTDTAGRPFGLNGYQPLKPGEYGEQLLAINAVHEEGMELAKKAMGLTGAEKAKGLSRAIPDLPGALVARFFRPEIEAVLEADSEDTLKLAGPFRKLLAEADYGKEIQRLARESKWSEMITATDRLIASQRLEGEALQGALLNRAGFERRGGNSEAFRSTLSQVIAINANSAPGEEASRLLKSDGATAPHGVPAKPASGE